MNVEQFRDKVKVYEGILREHSKNKLIWIEPHWFYIEPTTENESSISIRFEFDEIKVGIDQVNDYYSDKYGECRMYNDGFKKFLTLLTVRIKRQLRFKGNFHYRTDYPFEENTQFITFGTFLTWAFPFWRKTQIKEFVQISILKREFIQGVIG